MQKKNLTLIRGDDNQFLFTFRQKSGELLPLTGARLDLYAIDEQGERVLTCSTETGEFSVETNGKVRLTIGHSLTAGQHWEHAEYDLQITDQQGYRTTVLTGKMSLYHDKTDV